MQHDNEQYAPDFEQLVRYVFHELPSEEEARMNAFLDANPHDADIVDGMIRFCLDRGLRTRADYEAAMAQEKNAVLPRPLRPVWPRWAWAAAAAVAAIVVWVMLKQPQPPIIVTDPTVITPPDTATASTQDTASVVRDWQFDPAERAALCKVFLKKETDQRNSAGGNDGSVRDTTWEYWFVNDTPNYDKALRLLREKEQKSPGTMQTSDYYVLGALCLLYDPKHGPKPTPADAVRFLEKAEGVMGRPDYGQLMLIAYLQNKQYKEARRLNVPRSKWPKGAERWLSER